LIHFDPGEEPVQRSEDQETLENSSRPFIQHWKVEDFHGNVSTQEQKRNPLRGESLFSETGCFRCHRIAGSGGIIGPDLTGVGRRFTEKDLLEAIIEPNRVISDQYRAAIFTLTDGKSITGHIADMQKDRWSVITNMLRPRNYTQINPDKIEQIEPSSISMMPTGLLDTLTREEILDLLSYLRADRDRS
ncbi:MAG: c-type cytochrome, partial [Pirellulales bacterium]|nr:c-type cytochrome [Pirellulales bacterium]